MTRILFRFKLLRYPLALALALGTLFISCSKSSSNPPAPIDKTALKDSVAVAVALYAGGNEGSKPGQYEVGAKAALKTVIDAANAIIADGNATQTAVTNALAQLQ